MKKYILILCVLGLLSCKQKEITINSESFSVYVGNDNIKGILNVPSNFKKNDKIAILIPQNYDMDSLFPSLSSTLNENFIANLYLEDENEYTRGNIISVYERVKRINTVIDELRKDSRLSESKIGLIDKGNAASILSSENKNVAFVVTISPMGIKGVEFKYNRQQSLYKQLITEWLEGQKTDNGLDSIALKDIRNTTDSTLWYYKQKLEIIESHNDIDTIIKYLDEISVKQKKIGLSQQEIDNENNSMIELNYMELIKFHPEQYYSKITCPTLATFGKFDLDNYLENSEALKKINANLDIMIFDSLNGLVKMDEPAKYQIVKIPKKSKNHFSKDAFAAIVNWINKI